jgi:hypothetical protein
MDPSDSEDVKQSPTGSKSPLEMSSSHPSSSASSTVPTPTSAASSSDPDREHVDRDIAMATMMAEEPEYDSFTPRTLNKFGHSFGMFKTGMTPTASYIPTFDPTLSSSTPKSAYHYQMGYLTAPDPNPIEFPAFPTQSHPDFLSDNEGTNEMDANKKKFRKNLRVAIPDKPNQPGPHSRQPMSSSSLGSNTPASSDYLTGLTPSSAALFYPTNTGLTPSQYVEQNPFHGWSGWIGSHSPNPKLTITPFTPEPLKGPSPSSVSQYQTLDYTYLK